MLKYQVDEYRILGTDIAEAMRPSNCTRIVLQLTLVAPLQLKLIVFAADDSNSPIGQEIHTAFLKKGHVDIDYHFNPAYGAISVITRKMMSELQFSDLELRAKRYKPKNNATPHGYQDFIGWKVKDRSKPLMENELNPSPPARPGSFDNDVA